MSLIGEVVELKQERLLAGGGTNTEIVVARILDKYESNGESYFIVRENKSTRLLLHFKCKDLFALSNE